MPLYGALSRALADSSRAEDILDNAAPGQRRPVLLLAAIHDRLLEIHPGELGSPDDLGAWYPTVASEPRPPDAGLDKAAAAFLDSHRGPLSSTVATRTTQTNEPNRSVAWHIGLAAATADLPDTPVVWIELGASAGLNLAFDRYAVELGGVRRGPRDATVVLHCEPRGGRALPEGSPPPPIVDRWGVDVRPVDLADPVERRWLRACLWPEQPDRIERFDAAVEQWSSRPYRVDVGDAIDSAGDLSARIAADRHVIVAHSWMLTYVARDRRELLDAELRGLASGRPVTWLSLEAPGVVAALPHLRSDDQFFDDAGSHSLLGMTRFRGAERDDRIVALAHPHLRWVEPVASVANP